MDNSKEVHVKEVSKGNSEFRHSHNHKGGSILEVLDDMLGNLSGILYIWEASMFKKAYVTVSDNFIAIYETWISNNSKDGESIVIGDFNDVRSNEERLGSVFNHSSDAKSIKENLTDIDKNLDRGNVSDELLLKRMDFTRQLLEIKQMEAKDWVQKSKIKWAIERDENSKYLHGQGRFKLNFLFPNRLSNNQVTNLDRCISHDEIRGDVWNCRVNKSHGLDGFTFEFFRRYWSFIGADFCSAIDCFFETGNIPMGSNASFIALIPEVTDAKFVTDFKPITLIGCVYKVVMKILANRLAMVITDLKQAMIFKVDFAKAYDSVRWDYLLDVLHAFGFGPNWCKWIRGMFSSFIASVLVNGNPSSEFPFFCGLKQGDPLAPYLFILIMESLHIFFSRATSAGLKINIQKNQILGVGVHRNHVNQTALLIGYTVMQTPFRYLGVMVGGCMARKSSWSDIVHKSHHRLSKWKVKTLSIGGRLTLLKSILGATPLYNMSIYKVLIGILKEMESIRSNFFKGADHSDRKISWVSWEKVLASKQNGGPGVSSFYALNRALLLKWVWRFISQTGLYGIELFKPYSMVGSKLGPLSVDVSFRRPVRDGVSYARF
nr:RNA-directed DNA polymerase, eukaryota [Tanacetum cinerariifolium]